MKKSEQRGYLAPEIEVNEIEVEQGFAGSNGESGGGEDVGDGTESDW